MKRFLVFTGCDYYPDGGFEDFVTDTSTLSEALIIVQATDPDNEWGHIYDTELRNIVFKWSRGEEQEL